MIFWTAVIISAAGLALAVVRPLLRSPKPEPMAREAYDLSVYRDQLAEIDRDRDGGVLGDDQALAARLEIERRLLATVARQEAPIARHNRSTPLVGAGLALAVPVLAILLYLELGRPGLSGQPFAERHDVLPVTRTAGIGSGQPPAGQHPGGVETGSMLQVTDRLAKRLEQSGGGAEDWSLLARSYQQLDRHRDAVGALERAVVLSNRDPRILSALGEARIMASDGTVPERARVELEEVVKRDPRDPRANFYLALAESQAGRMDVALDRLVALGKETSPDEPFLVMIRDGVVELAEALKRDPTKLLAGLPQPKASSDLTHAASPSTTPPAAADDGVVPRGPSTADVAAASQMTPDQRLEMIRGMVGGLAGRLEGNAGDVEGWLRLIRAYKVLGDDAKAWEAASKASAANHDAFARIADLVQQLGIIQPVETGALPPTDRAIDAAEIRRTAPVENIMILRRRLDDNPSDREALFHVGLAEAAVGNRIGAAELWGRLLGQLDPTSAEYAALRERLDGLKRGG